MQSSVPDTNIKVHKGDNVMKDVFTDWEDARMKMVKKVLTTKDDILIGAMVRSFMRNNNTCGWYIEVVKVTKETPKTYVIEFDGKKHTLKKFGKNGSVNTVWDNYADTRHFKLLTTARDLYMFLWDYVSHLQKQVVSLKKDIAAFKGKGKWMPVNGE